MNTDKLLNMLLEAIDYSFLQTDGSYDKTLTYPVIDKIQYIKEQVKKLEEKEVDLEKEIDKFYGMYRKNGKTYSTEDNKECLDWKVDCNPNFEKAFAKHFFELGIAASDKAQKGEEL